MTSDGPSTVPSFDEDSALLLARMLHRQAVERAGKRYRGSSRLLSPARRKNHCFDCKHGVDSQLHAICNECSKYEIICPSCGSCGCVRGMGMHRRTSEYEFTDTPESWIVEDDGVGVFPPMMAGRTLPKSPNGWNLRMRYRAYMNTTSWREKRTGALKNAFFRCERCGDEAGGLHVHHKTYQRFGGDENPEDLEALCARCHLVHHEFLEVYIRYVRGDPE
jgi:hypothetical protein